MKANSLAFRLVAGAAIWSIAALAAGGFMLSSIFSQHVEDNFDASLAVLLDAVIAVVEVDADGALHMGAVIGEPRFEKPFSGWYWQISGRDGVLLRSRSLWDQELPPRPGKADGGLSRDNARGPDDQRLRIVGRIIVLPDSEDAYIFEVAGDRQASRQDIQRFNRTLSWSLGVLLLGLVGAVLFQVRFGLRPLGHIRKALADIRSGEAERLEGEFPAEITPLADELNVLLEHNAEIVERARTHVGNLAHALKTPLSVLTNEAAAPKEELGPLVTRQAGLMRRQVDYYLVRARTAATGGVLGARAEVAPVARDLARTLERIHTDKGPAIHIDCPEGLVFRGERQDLEEMLGNLMDNGCKWAKKEVRFEGRQEDGRLVLCFDDDGPGMPDAERKRLPQRGLRLDESVPGTGLGLDIVRDIAALYDAEFSLERSPLGGLRAVISLPI